MQKHAPSLKYFRFHASDPKERESQKDTMLKDILKYDIIITTYEMAKNPNVVSLIRSTYFNLCVLDEGHVIKSLTSQISEAVRRIHARGRVILTGTPMQNNLVSYLNLHLCYHVSFFTSSPNHLLCSSSKMAVARSSFMQFSIIFTDNTSPLRRSSRVHSILLSIRSIPICC